MGGKLENGRNGQNFYRKNQNGRNFPDPGYVWILKHKSPCFVKATWLIIKKHFYLVETYSVIRLKLS